MSAASTLDLDNLGKKAQSSPSFEVWDQFFEGAEDLIYEQSQQSGVIPESVILKVEELCERLLTQCPLLVRYWKRYVTMEYQMRGLEASLKVLKNGLHTFNTSAELWCDYLSIVINNKLEDSSTIEDIFKQAIHNCGRQFLSHSLWDSYLEWLVTLHGESEVYLSTLLEVVQIPLYEYSKYHKSLLECLQSEISKGKIKRLLQVFSEEELYRKVDRICYKTQEATNQRWSYESLIRQPFFTFEGPSDDEVINWNNYLDFEELQGDRRQVMTLYERCLIPCSRLESFWIRYVTWFQRTDQNGLDQLMTIFRKGSDLFLPQDCLKFRFMFATYLCNTGDDNVDVALNIYHSMAKKLPGNFKVVKNYLQAVSQRAPKHNVVDDLEIVLKERFDNTNKAAPVNYVSNNLVKVSEILNERTIAVVLISLIKHYWALGERESIELLRSIFLKYYKHEYLKPTIPFWTLFFKFEFIEKFNLTNVVHFVNSSIHVPIAQKLIILNSFKDSILNHSSGKELSIKSDQRSKSMAATQLSLLNSQVLFFESTAGVPHETRDLSDGDKRLFDENGHLGISIEKQPSVTNILNFKRSIFEETLPASLPTFKNVEKAAQPVRFEI